MKVVELYDTCGSMRPAGLCDLQKHHPGDCSYAPLPASAKQTSSLPAAYSAEALASAVGEWAVILSQVDARLGMMGVPEPIAVATCRSLVRAMSEAMKFTSLAAKEAHEQNEKEEKSR